MTEERYVYSIDGSEFRGNDQNGAWESRDEALAAGRARAAEIAALKDAAPGSVWTGVKVYYFASSFYPDTSTILEHMIAVAEGEVGLDAVDDWLDFTSDSEQENDLKEFLEQTMHPFLDTWIEKHALKPKFWGITEVVKHADDDGALVKT